MVRAFSERAVPPSLVDDLLDRARHAPSAGHTQGTEFVVLDEPDQVARYWSLTMPGERRSSFAWPGLIVAPVLVVVVCSPDAYVARYGESDKASTGLGAGAAAWSTPYWYVDAGMVVQNLLLGVVEAGLGACLFGLFDHEEAVLADLGVPKGWLAVGTVALGWPAVEAQRPGRSAGRERRRLDEVVHRSGW